MTVAWIFAGQGAQAVGMGIACAESSPNARRLFDEASKELGYDLFETCRQGPQERLNRTDVSQPALLVASLAALECYRERKPDTLPMFVAGLSLGEITACAAAGALEFRDALRLVRVRGEAMQAACDLAEGGMISVLGLARDAVRRAVEEARAAGPIAIANLNGGGQIVVSGARAALDRAADLLRAVGARRLVPLRVAGAYHSPLMEPARERFAGALRAATFRKARVPVVSNVDAAPHTDPEELRELLARQIVSSVLWEDCVRRMWDGGARVFIEFGPGRVLSGLVRKILPEAVVYSVEHPEDVEAACGST